MPGMNTEGDFKGNDHELYRGKHLLFRKWRYSSVQITVVYQTSLPTESTLSIQAPPPCRSTLFPSPKLLGHAPASFAQGENGGECQEATLSRFLL